MTRCASPLLMTTTIYTDGACSGNPGPGGWAWAIEGGAHKSGADPKTTNQRMELMAVLDAVRSNSGPVEIVSDSTYVVNCFRDRWYLGWLKRGWVNAKNQPVANRDIWEPLIELVLARKNVTFRWLKGHSGHPMNDFVDRLAVEATRAGRGVSSLDAAQAGPAPATAQPAQSTPKFVVIFRAELLPNPPSQYSVTAERLRALAFSDFGCLEFHATREAESEVALSYWPDEASITAWKAHADHVLAQEQARSTWYKSYRVEVARIGRRYSWSVSS